MDWWTTLPASIALLWLLCFIDDNAVLELRLLLHSINKLACHLYLALLQQRRALKHFFHCVSHVFYCVSRTIFECLSQIIQCARDLIERVNNIVDTPKEFLNHRHHQHGARTGALHFIEAMSVVCETLPNLTYAALSVVAVICHAVQVVVYVLASTLRYIQTFILLQTNGEKEMWTNEREGEKETYKMMKSKVLQYISVANEDPATTLRINVGIPPVHI